VIEDANFKKGNAAMANGYVTFELRLH